VRKRGHDGLELTIHEGRKRQVRRMLDAIGHPAVSLCRVRFGTLELGALEEGRWRRLSEVEIDKLRRAASGAATQTAIRGVLRSGGPNPARGRSRR
jgi:23S rRNA pseudouridine2605 synthase